MRRCLDAGGHYAAVEFTSEALALGAAEELAVPGRRVHEPEPRSPGRPRQCRALPREQGAAFHGAARRRRGGLQRMRLERGADGRGGSGWRVELIRYGAASRGEPWGELDLVARSVTRGLVGHARRARAGARFEGAPPDVRDPRDRRGIRRKCARRARAPRRCRRATRRRSACARRLHAAARALRASSPRDPHVVIDYAHSPDALDAHARHCAEPVQRSIDAGLRRGRRSRSRQAATARRGRGVRPIASSSPATTRAPKIRGRSPRRSAPGSKGSPRSTKSSTGRARSKWRSARRLPDDVIVMAGKGHELEQIAQRRKTAILRRGDPLGLCARRLPT